MKKTKQFIDADMKTRIASWLVLALLLATCYYMLNLALLTFIMVFVFYHLQLRIKLGLLKLGMKKPPDRSIAVLIYILFAAALGWISTMAFPAIVQQVSELGTIVSRFQIEDMQTALDPRLYSLISGIEFDRYIDMLGTGMVTAGTIVGGFGFNIFLAYILSLAMLLEKESIRNFGLKLEGSRISYIYKYCLFFGASFANTFGKVMKVQVMIAFINCIISMVALAVMGFPQIPALGLMIFILGLVPVAGVFVSLIPLCIIAFNIGGLMKVVAVIAMIAIIHALEAYILNPNLMANKTKLPVCLVFIILVVGEHYLGPWGLLIGVPIFMFLMDIAGATYQEK
jgi:predicted PurR-regulated permease PerM